MTEREWKFRRAVPSVRAKVRSLALQGRDYVAAMAWIALCSLAWSVIAMLFWRWFITAPFGVPTISLFEAIGIALVGWVFREAAFGDTQRPLIVDAVAQVRVLAWALGLGWIVHLFVPAA